MPWKSFRYACRCKPSWFNAWEGGYHVESHEPPNVPPTSTCEHCHHKSKLIVSTPPAKNTGGRRYPRWSETCGRHFDSASDHRKYLKNPTDFKGKPLTLPDGTALRYHEV